MGFPEWTDVQFDEPDAIQYLRLNELRDYINKILFPYITTITPYFRMVSWLTWIFNRLEYERINSKRMTLPEYVDRALRYYGIFATADTLYAQSSESEHWGPIGVEAIVRKLGEITRDTVDFNHPSLAKPRDPTPIYKSSLVVMGLFEERRQPLPPRRFQSILIPTEKGKELAQIFEKKWKKIIEPDVLANKFTWEKNELTRLGKAINLQGLTIEDEESDFLIDSARSSMKYPKFYDGFIDIAIQTATIFDEKDLYLDASDISKAALYGKLKIEDSDQLINIKLKNTQTAALLAYHELHTHMSYGADAILDGLVSLAKENSMGVIRDKILSNVNKFLENEPLWDKGQYLEEIFKSINDSFISAEGNYQLGYPNIWGPYGFENIQYRIQFCKNKYQQIAWGSIALLQSAASQNLFEPKWLRNILPYHREVFSAYTILEEYQALQSKARIKDWISTTIELIIQKHDEVANSKGTYAKRLETVGNKIFHRADAGFNQQRGRLTNAVIWLSDVGILKRSGALFTKGA